MSPVTTQEITKNIYAVQDRYVTLFLIKTGTQYIAIDAGIHSEKVHQELKKLAIDPQDIMAVFLTHSDSDHTGGLDLFKNAVIYLPAKEEQMINGQTFRLLFLKNRFNHRYTTLEDNQTIYISGLTIKGISTPGHTPGSMCYRVNDAYLFTGDTMSLENGKVKLFNAIFNMDSQIQQISHKKLADIPGIEAIFTAHYGFTNKVQTAFDK